MLPVRGAGLGGDFCVAVLPQGVGGGGWALQKFRIFLEIVHLWVLVLTHGRSREILSAVNFSL